MVVFELVLVMISLLKTYVLINEISIQNSVQGTLTGSMWGSM